MLEQRQQKIQRMVQMKSAAQYRIANLKLSASRSKIAHSK